MLKRNSRSNPPKKRPRIAINFNRKILSHATLQNLKDTLNAQTMVRGEAIEGVVDDLMKLRYLCENIVDLYDQDRKEEALQGLEMLRMVI